MSGDLDVGGTLTVGGVAVTGGGGVAVTAEVAAQQHFSHVSVEIGFAEEGSFTLPDGFMIKSMFTVVTNQCILMHMERHPQILFHTRCYSCPGSHEHRY